MIHPDFVKEGLWSGSATEWAMTAFLRTQGRTDKVSRPVLLRHLRADGTRIEDRDVPQPHSPPHSQDSSGCVMIEADEATKVIEVRTATEEEVVVVFILTSKTEVQRVRQTLSPTFPATVADLMQAAPTANA